MCSANQGSSEKARRPGSSPASPLHSCSFATKPELAVEPLDQALAVLVGLLVSLEALDLLGAQTVEPRGDLIDVLLVVAGDGEGCVAMVSSAFLAAVSTSLIPCFWKGNITLLVMPGKGKLPHCPKKRL